MSRELYIAVLCTIFYVTIFIFIFANVVGRMLCIHPCLFVCVFVCLSVSRITQKLWTDLNKILREGSQLPKDHSITFWW